MGLIAVLMMVLPQALGALVKSNVQIGWDAQDYKCLPFSLYVFKMESTRPADVAVRRGAMVVFKAHDGNTGIPVSMAYGWSRSLPASRVTASL